MTHLRLITTLLAGAAVALAQTPPPDPAASPAPPAPQVRAATPAPAAAPAPMARAMALAGADELITPEIEAQIEAARDQLRDFRFEFDSDAFREQMDAAREQIRNLEPAMAYARSFGRGVGAGIGNGFAFAPQIAPMPPTPPAARAGTMIRMNGSPDRAYTNGQSALDSRHWEDAVQYFNIVISRGATRADGALYWKAYALAKLGRRDEALAAIAELRKNHASSRWLDDAKALEIEVNQAGGRPTSPEAENDEDLKLLAIQGLMQTDPERYLPALEKILKGSGSPKLKRNALYVLAGSSSPKAQALIEQIARGAGNPDLQVKAIAYMTERRRGNANTANGQTLSEIYAATTDIEVKRAVLNAFRSANDKDRLLAAAKNEKNPDLRSIAIDYLGNIPGNAELWQLYQTETTTEGKEQMINHMYNNGNPDRLLELLRTEKEPKLRAQVARVLGSYRTQQVNDGLIAAYTNEQDQQVKNAIIDAVSSQRNGKAMVDLAKAEKDSRQKIRLVERLSNMKNCKECSDYLMELLNK